MIKCIVVTIVALLVLTPVAVITANEYGRVTGILEMESQCIQKYIRKGVERRDIHVSKGSCYIITN